jgi:hypothetical protein
MNEILAYIGNNRRRVTVGYKLPDGKVIRAHRKIDGQDRTSIEQAIEDVKATGVNEVLIEVYRPNGTAEVICKTFTLPNTGTVSAKPLGAAPTLFGDQEPTGRKPLVKQIVQRNPLPQNNRPMETQSWKDYALKTEQDKVSKLEAEVKRLTIENKSYDTRIRDFEKEMIKKDHELEKLQVQITSKSGLGGFLERAAENPQMANVLSGIASRLLGLPENSQASLNASNASANPHTEQFVANIRAWMEKQPMELQEQFYQLVYEVTNTPTPSETILQLINLIKNGTVLKRTA